MNDYIEVRIDIEPCSEAMTDVAAALLAERGFESFVPDEKGLTAYIKSGDYWDEAPDITDMFPFDATLTVSKVELIQGRDWNAEWEKNYFKPIVVGGECVIHSSFHTDIPKCAYDIVIDPKMAFGTGHHATTSLIVEQLLAMDLQGLSMVDMGTGTGILAILAAMRGASPVIAIEIDPMAHANAVENVALNGHDKIRVLLGDAALLAPIRDTDLFVANINRNIITADLESYARTLRQDGRMLLSGFYVEDIPVVEAEARKHGLKQLYHTERDRWTCLVLAKS